MKNDTYDEKTPETSVETPTARIKMKIPETTDKPKHSEATASVYTYGLSVMCANENDKTAEIAFVKDEHSAVEILVYKGGCGVPFWSHKCDINKKTKIGIQKSNPSDIGRLYKDSKKDKADFDWMPDLNGDKWYPNTKIGIQATAKKYLSAKLILKDAHFYTSLKSIHNAMQDRKDGGQKVNLGKIGRVIGADIFCDDNDTEITITIDDGSKPCIEHFPKKDGPFFISVATDANSDSNHLHHLYHHIIDLPGVNAHYDFEYEHKEQKWALCPKDDDKIGILVTTYACQTFPGGDGPLPEFP